ncbi:hypothetical protein [Streptomyces sp. NPDC058086]|uniref:hypothetical protein n=1 Tax=Streptomyces sp. NPDC058086 TaxID=3346334 RepID=UPI0036EBE1BE
MAVALRDGHVVEVAEHQRAKIRSVDQRPRIPFTAQASSAVPSASVCIGGKLPRDCLSVCAEVAVNWLRGVLALAQRAIGALKLKKRFKRFVLDAGFDHLPVADVVSVALDEWLAVRGL